MPFALRKVQPEYVSRARLHDQDGRPLVQDDELEAVFNHTLCQAIRQLSSLLEAADDMFAGLTKEMAGVTTRAGALQERIKKVQDLVDAEDPRIVPVPEGDLCAFAALPRDAHFSQESRRPITLGLFSAATRPAALQQLYEAASRPALDARALQQLDRMRRDGKTTSNLFLCRPYSKPSAGEGRGRAPRVRGRQARRDREETLEIETMKPAALHDLRRWTSVEAMGDVTVHPDCTIRITSDTTGLDASEEVDGAGGEAIRDQQRAAGDATLGASVRQDEVDHQLPTTEEQVKAIAGRFPPEVVKMDVTGRPFTRMSRHRRSLIHPGPAADAVVDAEVRRRTRPRRQRSRRRNTIAGTDQKEIEEALGADRSAAEAGVGTLATVDDMILSSSAVLHPKCAKEAHSDLKKWAFNSLKRWGRSRLRAIGQLNSSTSSNLVSGELHAADPVDDINVYETVAVKRRGAGNIPITAGLSGPMSLAVKLREGALGHRRLKISDDPPHSSSGNWSASSESGRASVNSDSSHQPKSSTCSSVLPNRRRFINHSTSSSVTSEGTLTPEDMAAAPFLDDGETSSVYSCDTEGYYTSFHMDSGLKTLKEEEVGAGLSLPATPMHSTSALSNCSSGRGSASLAQLTAESEYELFGKGSTSTTASSAGTVCTTLLVDNSRGGDNSLGSDRSLSSKGPAVPERKSSLNVPCSSQECPPCSTVVALIHNTSQGHSPRSLSGDSPDSGHNTSSSPANSVSGPRDMETDALISPIPSLGSEMEFSECSDFEGTDRIERIRVKTTINTSRIPSMCAITPPQSDDETSVRQFASSGDDIAKPNSNVRAAAPLPQNTRNDNNCYSQQNDNQRTDGNANKTTVDDNCNARPTTPVTSTSMTSIIHVDQKSGYATVETLDNGPKESNNNQKIRPPSPSGGTLIINSKFEEDSSSQPLHQLPLIKDALIPFSNMLSKFRKTSSTKIPANACPIAPQSRCDNKDLVPEESDSIDESGEYVTITDMRNNNKPSSLPQCPPQRSEISESVCESTAKTWENQEYVSLNEIPAPDSSKHPAASVLSGSSSESSLERKKRQGARVMLDSEGKVVYSSDSLRRRKGAHTTFAPGQFVKDTSVSPSPSPVARHRMPKSIIRPVQSQASGLPHGINTRSPSHSASKSLLSETSQSGGSVPRPLSLQTRPITSFERGSPMQPSRASMLQTSDLLNQRNNRVIIRAGLVSPTEDLTNRSMRSMSPRNTTPTRGAYVHVQPDNRPSIKTNPMFLQTDFDGPDDVSLQRESQQPQNNSEGKKAVSTNRNVLTIGGETGEALKNKKVQRSASYRMANFSPLISVCDVDINKDQGDGDVDQGVADLGEARPKLSLSPNVSYNSAENVLNVLNPNMTGRRFYGAQVMVSPNILLSLSPNRVTKPADTQRAKVLSTAGNDTEIW